MKRVRSIFGIFTVFLLIILASFLLLSWQSTANLKASLIQTAQLQTKYAATLLEQKGKEIEIEADGILYGENMQNLYAAIENNDVYEYVQQINKMKTINEQISNFAQTYPTNLKASSNEALLFMRRYRFANCSCFSCCFKDAYPSSNVQ